MKSRNGDQGGGALQDLLIRCCRPDDKGHRSISLLAKQLGMSGYGVYKWVQSNYLPARKASVLVDMAEGDVTLDEFLPYVFKK